jgi:hypothetical protein
VMLRSDVGDMSLWRDRGPPFACDGRGAMPRGCCCLNAAAGHVGRRAPLSTLVRSSMAALRREPQDPA